MVGLGVAGQFLEPYVVVGVGGGTIFESLKSSECKIMMDMHIHKILTTQTGYHEPRSYVYAHAHVLIHWLNRRASEVPKLSLQRFEATAYTSSQSFKAS